MDLSWQMVTCKDCGRHYRCTPQDDYYNSTTDSDGVCEPCLIGDLPLVVEGEVLPACQAGREFIGPSCLTPCPVPATRQILLTDGGGPTAVAAFCEGHFQWLQANVEMRPL